MTSFAVDEDKSARIRAALRAAKERYCAGDFNGLRRELRQIRPCIPPEARALLGEWILLSSFAAYPNLALMLKKLRAAASMLGGPSAICRQPIELQYPDFMLLGFHSRPGRTEEELALLSQCALLYSELADGCARGADVAARAVLSYTRGDYEEAELHAYKACYQGENAGQLFVVMAAAALLAHIAKYKSDLRGWNDAVARLERTVSKIADKEFAVVAQDVYRGELFNTLSCPALVAGWLKEGDFSSPALAGPLRCYARFVHANTLLVSGEYEKAAAAAQAALAEKYMYAEMRHCFAEIYFNFITASALICLGDKDGGAACIAKAAEAAVPDGHVLPFIEYAEILDGAGDRHLAAHSRRMLMKTKKIRDCFIRGRNMLHDAALLSKLPESLSGREKEIAALAAAGLKNREIAGRMFISENTVKSHLKSIFKKLEIEKRTELLKRLRSKSPSGAMIMTAALLLV